MRIITFIILFSSVCSVAQLNETQTGKNSSAKSALFNPEIENQNLAAHEEEIVAQPKSYIMYNAGLLYTPFGFRFGYGTNWGGYLAARFGQNGFEQVGDTTLDVGIYSLTLGISKRLYKSNDFKLTGYAGAGLGSWGDYKSYEDRTVPGDTSNGNQPMIVKTLVAGNAAVGAELEYGLFVSYKKLVLSAGLTHNLTKYRKYLDATVGLGIRF